MTPVSEAVERVRAESAKLRRQKERNPYAPIAWGADIIAANAALADSMDAILADHARLTEQVRVAREGLDAIATRPLKIDLFGARVRCPSCNIPWEAGQDEKHWRGCDRVTARETLTRMEKNDD